MNDKLQAAPLNFPAISDLNENLPNSVNARELHEFLEVGRDFTNWIKSRIEDYQFIEKQDFIVFAKSGEKSFMKLGRPRVDYYLTLDMVKELAMLERNHKGRLARQHFIKMEKQAHISQAQYQGLQQQVLRLQALVPMDPVDKQILELKQFQNAAGKGLTHVIIGSMLGLGAGVIRRRVRRLEQLGKLAPPANLFKMQQQSLNFLPSPIHA